MYTQLNQYHVILETTPSAQQGQPNSRIYTSRRMRQRRLRPWSFLILRLLGILFGRLECDDDYSCLHASSLHLARQRMPSDPESAPAALLQLRCNHNSGFQCCALSAFIHVEKAIEPLSINHQASFRQ